MCQQRSEVQAAVTNEFHEAAHALLSTWAESRDDFMVAEACGERFEWNGKFAGIDAKAGESSSGAENAKGAFECGLCAQRFNRNIDAFTSSQPANLRDGIGLGVIDNYIRAYAFCHGGANWVRFHCDNQARALESSSGGGAETDGALHKNGDRVPDVHFAVLSRRNPGRGDVRK